MLKRSILLLLFMLGVAACTNTGNTANDAQAAQRLLPNITTYTATNVDTALDAAFTTAGGAALAGGQVQVTAAVAKANQMLQCLQDRGAAAANFYTEKGVSGESLVPKVGAVLVLNQTRVSQEFLNCALGGQEQGFSSQAVVEPCASNGSFTYQGDTITYVYVASDPALCSIFEQHFTSIKQNNAGG